MAKTYAPQYLIMAKKLNVYGAKHSTSMGVVLDAITPNSAFANLQAALVAFIAANPRAKETI